MSRRPADVLKLADWKLTIPAPRTVAGRAVAAEILHPQLDTYTDANFYASDGKPAGVVLRASCGAPTTSGSAYPRCELRQMHGRAEASWSCSGVAHMRVVESVDVLPPHKPQVVCAQIHNASADVIEVLGDGLNARGPAGSVALTVRFRGATQTAHLLDRYTLGTPFTLDVNVSHGVIVVSLNGAPRVKLFAKDSGCYFKAGCYTQSNTSTGDKASAYGQVTIYELAATSA